MENINVLKSDFTKLFAKDAESVFFSPGRVNLIGEHTDYNEVMSFLALLLLELML